MVALLLLVLPVVAQGDLQLLRGKFQPEKKPGFKVIPAKLSPGRVQYLDERALAAFEKMAAAAQKAGFQLTIISATRNFTTQKAIWEQKFSGIRKVRGKDLTKTIPNEEQRALEILRYSSMPGTSRHHWGTDLDLHEAKLTGPALSNETLSKGRGLDLYNWLLAHASEYGFCQPYKGNPSARNAGRYAHGYEEERWHWSYQPVSSEYLKSYTQQAGALVPGGFLGDKASGRFYLDYVKNIDPGCL
ncbi:MAG: M15 family metallopeptidase [Spirochaetota bacterium]